MQQLAFLPNLSPIELAVVAIVALLLFGRRLPEVARNMGKGIVEFKKGIKGIEDEIDTGATHAKPAIAAQPPLTATGQDARVSHAEPVEVKHEADQGGESSKDD